MDLLVQLGVNQTLGIQLIIFVAVFIVLKYLLFDSYYAALNERRDRTLGKTELAERFVAEARELEERFTARAQEANERYREIYDKTRGEALREYDRLVSEGRDHAKAVVDEATGKIQRGMEAARTQLSQEVLGVSQLINQKLIGKDLGT